MPPLLGIALNLVLTGVLVRYLLRTDQLALVLSGEWIALGIVAYYALGWLRSPEPAGGPTADDESEDVTDIVTDETD